VQDKLYDGEPSGVSTYSTNRESYDSGGGGGTVFEIPDEYVTEDELQAGLQGEPITFYGYDLDSEKSIELTHGLKRTNVITIIAVNGVPIDPANFRREYITDLKIKLNILKPYEDTTEFTARFL
jgi:hypothetical protein